MKYVKTNRLTIRPNVGLYRTSISYGYAGKSNNQLEEIMKPRLKTPSIRVTTLLQAALFAILGGYIGAEYQAMKQAAAQSDTQVLQDAGFVNMAVEKPLPRYIDQGVY